MSIRWQTHHTAMTETTPKANPWVFFLPLSVGFSQVYVGKNYPFDVLVGWLLGLVSVIAVWWVCHLIIIRFSSHRKLG